jgi:hypothetical protein
LATTSNLYVDQGSDYATIITVTSATGAPLNLADYVVKSQMRKSYSSTVAYNFTASVYDQLTGKILLRLSAADSEEIPHGRWLYDVEITNTETGIKRRVVEGIVLISPQITQI